MMNALALTRNGVLVPAESMREHALLVGDNIRVIVTTYRQSNELDLTIVGAFDLFPTWYPSEGPLFVGNLDYLFEQAGGLFPYSVWLNGAADADYEYLADDGLTNKYLDWSAPTLDIAVEQRLPERQGLFGLLSVGFAAAAVLTVLGFLLYALFSFRRRFIEFGVLRAVGLSAQQMISFLGWELAFLILMGGGLGTVLGGWVSAFFIPFLQVGVDETSRIPPYVVDVAWSAIFQIYVLFGILFVVALVALIVMLRRMRIFEAVKLGETA
jgi:putative ABC transport system permease protein